MINPLSDGRPRFNQNQGYFSNFSCKGTAYNRLDWCGLVFLPLWLGFSLVASLRGFCVFGFNAFNRNPNNGGTGSLIKFRFHCNCLDSDLLGFLFFILKLIGHLCCRRRRRSWSSPRFSFGKFAPLNFQFFFSATTCILLPFELLEKIWEVNEM